METIKIILKGNIPSKKNSRINTRSGRSFPSKKYTEWHKDAWKQLEEQNIPRSKLDNFGIVVSLYPETHRRADSSNKFESIADLFVDYGVILDDNYFNMNPIHIEMIEVDKHNPRAEIRLIKKKKLLDFLLHLDL